MVKVYTTLLFYDLKQSGKWRSYGVAWRYDSITYEQSNKGVKSD